jgi:hypothetical protein
MNLKRKVADWLNRGLARGGIPATCYLFPKSEFVEAAKAPGEAAALRRRLPVFFWVR